MHARFSERRIPIPGLMALLAVAFPAVWTSARRPHHLLAKTWTFR